MIEPWDQWLQESLAASRTQLGADWLDRYLTSPLWRFVLSPGVAGQRGWAGVLMPSIDRVGRYFPLTLACPLPAGTNPIAVLSAADWFERAETLTLSVLDDPFSLDAFDAQVLALGAPVATAPAAAPPATADLAAAQRLAPERPRRVRPAGACATLLAQALDQVFLAYSLWWTAEARRRSRPHSSPARACPRRTASAPS